MRVRYPTRRCRCGRSLLLHCDTSAAFSQEHSMSGQRSKDLAPVNDEQSPEATVPTWVPLSGNLLLIFGGVLVMPWEKPVIFTAVGIAMIMAGNYLRRCWVPQQT